MARDSELVCCWSPASTQREDTLPRSLHSSNEHQRHVPQEFISLNAPVERCIEFTIESQVHPMQPGSDPVVTPPFAIRLLDEGDRNPIDEVRHQLHDLRTRRPHLHFANIGGVKRWSRHEGQSQGNGKVWRSWWRWRRRKWRRSERWQAAIRKPQR